MKLRRKYIRRLRRHPCFAPCSVCATLLLLYYAIPCLFDLYKLVRVTSLLPLIDIQEDHVDPLPTLARIPPIVHHLSKTTEINPEWDLAYRSSMGVHGRYAKYNVGYTFELWTDDRMEVFISTHYPAFYPTYQAYNYQIERVDAARYFILLHYGGIYLDLDVGCRRSLDNLRRTEATSLVLPITKPFGISNDFIMAAPGHPFLDFVTQRLASREQHSGRFAFLPFLSVLWTTGPLFFSVCMYDYLATHSKATDVALLSSIDYTKKLLYHLPGSSWLGWDGRIIMFTWWTVLPTVWRVVKNVFTLVLLVSLCVVAAGVAVRVGENRRAAAADDAVFSVAEDGGGQAWFQEPSKEDINWHVL